MSILSHDGIRFRHIFTCNKMFTIKQLPVVKVRNFLKKVLHLYIYVYLYIYINIYKIPSHNGGCGFNFPKTLKKRFSQLLEMFQDRFLEHISGFCILRPVTLRLKSPSTDPCQGQETGRRLSITE